MQSYDFLFPILEKFLEENGVKYISRKKPEYMLPNAENPLLQAASKKLGISPEIIYQTYIWPYEVFYSNFSPIDTSSDQAEETLKTIAALQTEWCANKGAGLGGTLSLRGQYVFKIERVDKSKTYTDKQWLVAWIVDLNLPGFPIKHDSPPITGSVLYWPPYLQCLYCGRVNTDKRGVPFNNKNKFCHVRGCKSGSNPTDHKHGCCYGEWRQLKKVFGTKLKRAADRSASKQEIERIFLEFLTGLFKDLQTKDMPHIRNYTDYKRNRIKEEWHRALVNIAESSLEEIVDKINLMHSWAEKIHPKDNDFWQDDFVQDAYGVVLPSLDDRNTERMEMVQKLMDAFGNSACSVGIKGSAKEIGKNWLSTHKDLPIANYKEIGQAIDLLDPMKT